MTVWETLWALDDIGKFEVLAPSVLMAFSVCFALWLVNIIFRSVHALQTSGEVVLKPRASLGTRVVYCLLAIAYIAALIFMLAAASTLFNVIEVTGGGSNGSPRVIEYSAFPPELPENLTRVLLPVVCSVVVFGLFGLFYCIMCISCFFHSFAIRDGGILAYLDRVISPFTPWTCIRRAIWYKPNAIRIELDNGCRKFSVHSMYVESVSESLVRFVEVVDHDTYMLAGKKAYPRPRYRLQFRLRTLMLVTLLLAVFMADLGARLREAVCIRQIAERLVQSGATIDNVGLDIRDVSWHKDGRQPTDDDLAILEELDYVTAIRVCGPRVTDEGLRHFRSLTTLEVLQLDGSRITDAGLEHLAQLKNLHTLSLKNTKVTNLGLVHLKRLPKLRSVYIGGTVVTRAAVAEVLPDVSVE